MPCYAGITTDIETRKATHQRDYPNLYGWEQHIFFSRASAQSWENQQTNCQHHPGGRDPESPGATWYGYKFYY